MRKTIAAVTLAGLFVLAGANPASAYDGPWTSATLVQTYTEYGLIEHGQGYVGSGMQAYTKWTAHAVCVQARYMFQGTWEYHNWKCEASRATITDWAQITQHRPRY